MPEGHTIHRLARDHSKWFAGKKVMVESPQGRFSEDATRISGKSLKSVEAYGKHLFYNFGGSKILHVHLGLYGRFRVYRTPLPEPCGAVRVRLFERERGFDLNGPNQCELVSSAEMRRLCEKLGQDPLRRDSDPIALWDRVTRSKKTIANILLDQSMIAGVGNIYRAEILFLLGIDPMRPGNELTKCEFNELWALTKRLMEIGVKYNRIITVNSESTQKPLSRLNRSESLNIYKKACCPSCNAAVTINEAGGRKLFSCNRCQR